RFPTAHCRLAHRATDPAAELEPGRAWKGGTTTTDLSKGCDSSKSDVHASLLNQWETLQCSETSN
ncbi:MAG TPA: hypothetical protein VKD72_07195, partial [Gemmataceae bacterium]|nr:hypothetical protein [Gemmataceae bacterium]